MNTRKMYIINHLKAVHMIDFLVLCIRYYKPTHTSYLFLHAISIKIASEAHGETFPGNGVVDLV